MISTERLHTLLDALRSSDGELELHSASFVGATFTGDARFDGATFNGYARFVGATFNGDADFVGGTFNGDADFDGTTFNGDADFDGTTFSGYADFDGASFSDASFDGATFSGPARFDRVRSPQLAPSSSSTCLCITEQIAIRASRAQADRRPRCLLSLVQLDGGGPLMRSSPRRSLRSRIARGSSWNGCLPAPRCLRLLQHSGCR